MKVQIMGDVSVGSVLRDARKLIESGWTQGVNARNEQGNAVTPFNKSAVCFCSIGSIILASRGTQLYFPAVRVLQDAVGRISIPSWNDSKLTTKEMVLTAFDKAIETCNLTEKK